MKVQCCVCKRVREDGKWISRNLDASDSISHTYCPACLEASMADMREQLAEARRLVPVAVG
mgnify:CR=1 FL=1